MKGDYVLEPLTAPEVERWDELILEYDTRQFFHRSIWLSYLEASQGVKVEFWRLRDQHGKSLGYFCAGVLKKGPFKVMGSPLRGWSTNFLGPVVRPDIDQDRLLAAVDDLARRERIAVLELEHPLMEGARLAASGYSPRETATYVVDLVPGDQEAMWKRLHSTRRRSIRKAERLGLTVEQASDTGIADEYYDQFTDVMRRKGLVPPYPRRTPRLLVEHLLESPHLLALRVKDAEGQVVATGLFPHGDRNVYFWGGASVYEARSSCPNDLLHWKVMCMAAERGVTTYNMSGDGRFKSRFGGTLVPLRRWRKCFWRSARVALAVFEAYFEAQSRVRGRVRNRLTELGGGS